MNFKSPLIIALFLLLAKLLFKICKPSAGNFRLIVFFIFITLFFFGQSIQLNAQNIPHTAGQWDRMQLGTQRAVIDVKDNAPAVWVHVPWRRVDNHENKAVHLVDAATGKYVSNICTLSSNREYGDFVFEPTSGKGVYYLYYMPFKQTGSWYFPNTIYHDAEKNYSAVWADANGVISAKGISKWPHASVVCFEAVNDFNRFDPMEIIATKNEVTELLEENKEKEFLIFPEDRKYPIRMDTDIPLRWIERGEGGSFSDTAMRNEFFTYQLGIYAPFKSLHHIKIKFTDLINDKGDRIPASAIRCFNLAGRDWLGKSFTKEVDVKKGAVHAMWIGVDINSNEHPGEYSGSISISAEGTGSRMIPIHIRVVDSLLKDRGYDDSYTMSRLNWLDSDIALDDSVYKPYEPMVVHGQTVSVLGRSLQFNKYGLPEKVRTTFTGSNDAINGPAKDILGGPVEIVVVNKGKKLQWKGTAPVIRNKQAGSVSWEANLQSGNIKLGVFARMECDGYVNYYITLTASKNTALDNVELQIPYLRSTAVYMMGLGFKGGKRPAKWDWKWEESRANNMLWMGDVNAGMQCKLKNEAPDWTVTNFNKTGPYKDWSNDGRGGCTINEETDRVLLKAFTGAKQLKAGDVMHLNFGLLITPVKPLDKDHWGNRYFQSDPPVDNWRSTALAKGATIMNVHQGNILNPYINYPFLTTDTLRKFVAANRKEGIRTKLYYTVRELSNHTPEIWPLRSLDSEVFTPGLGAQIADQFADDGLGGNIYSTGGYWLVEHLRTKYDAAWHTPLEDGDYDMAIRTQGLSRWHNYYLEGLNWLIKNTGIRGIYLDGVGYDREIMKRVRKVMDRAADSCLIDFHSGNNFSPTYGMNSPANQYMELFPYLNSLWLGEGYDENETPDYWLIEMSGIPYGLFGEMLNHGGNAYRGMVFGITSRLGWVHSDPSAIWKLWDAFGIKSARMIGYWDPAVPVKCNNDDVKVTVYKKDNKLMLAYASWAATDVPVRLEVDWKALNMDPAHVSASAPEVDGFQERQDNIDLKNIVVSPKKGGIIIIQNIKY